MSFKKVLVFIFFITFSLEAFANTPRSTGKYKNWESFVAETDQGKICFAQTKPTKRAPGAIKRNESKLFVTFRPADSINDEVSITSGHVTKLQVFPLAQVKENTHSFPKKILPGC